MIGTGKVEVIRNGGIGTIMTVENADRLVSEGKVVRAGNNRYYFKK